MMRYGIPRTGCRATCSTRRSPGSSTWASRSSWAGAVDDVLAAMAEGFDAVFLAVGAQLGKRAYIPPARRARIVDAVSMLHDVAQGEPPLLGRRVVVYGGGNTAVDAARTAKRLGATDSIIVYRRTRDRMPAHDSEMAEALEEGVVVKWLSTVAHADAGHLAVERMELDESGFPQPTGEFEDLEADPSCSRSARRAT